MINPYLDETTVFGREWLQKIRETNQLLRDNPDIHPAFKRWYNSYLARYGKTPEPPYTVREVESLLYRKQRDMAMTTGYAFKRPYATLSTPQISYQTAPKRIRITPESIQRAKAMAAARAITGKSRLEVKGMDTKLGSLPIVDTVNTNDSIAVLNLVQQGAGSWNRVGRKIFPKSIRIKGSILVTSAWSVSTPTQYGNYLRCILVWDKQPSGGSIPTFDTMFGVTEQTGTESTTVMSPLKYDNMDRFTVLKEWVLSSNPGSSGSTAAATGAGVHNIITFDEFYRFKGKFETVYSGQSNPMTLADISSGALYIVFRSRATTVDPVSSVALQPDVIARLRYTD